MSFPRNDRTAPGEASCQLVVRGDAAREGGHLGESLGHPGLAVGVELARGARHAQVVLQRPGVLRLAGRETVLVERGLERFSIGLEEEVDEALAEIPERRRGGRARGRESGSRLGVEAVAPRRGFLGKGLLEIHRRRFGRVDRGRDETPVGNRVARGAAPDVREGRLQVRGHGGRARRDGLPFGLRPPGTARSRGHALQRPLDAPEGLLEEHVEGLLVHAPVEVVHEERELRVHHGSVDAVGLGKRLDLDLRQAGLKTRPRIALGVQGGGGIVAEPSIQAPRTRDRGPPRQDTSRRPESARGTP